jgi:hypothetical protein
MRRISELFAGRARLAASQVLVFALIETQSMSCLLPHSDKSRKIADRGLSR